MKLVVVLVLILMSTSLKAQLTDSSKMPPYLKSRKLPIFNMLKTDSITYFNNTKLIAKKPTLFVVFSPDCSHCKTETKRIVDSMQYIKKVQIVFASIAKIYTIKDFVETYKLNTFSNVIVCNDFRNNLGVFFRLRKAPFIALYNKKGDLDTVYEDGAFVIDLYNKIKKMK